jgi:hypothetical protein
MGWQSIAKTLIICCGKCHVHSKCSNCCELDIDPQLTPQSSTESIKKQKKGAKEDLV